MIVFVLIEQDYDIVTVHGVFKTREKAHERIIALNEEAQLKFGNSSKDSVILHTEIQEVELE